MNIRVHSKCSKEPPAGIRSVVLSIPHSERNTPMQYPNWAWKSSSSDTDDLVLSTSWFHLFCAHLIESSSVIGMEYCCFSPHSCAIVHVLYLRWACCIISLEKIMKRSLIFLFSKFGSHAYPNWLCKQSHKCETIPKMIQKCFLWLHASILSGVISIK